MTKETKLLSAILAVQQGAPFIDKSSDNPFFKSKYAGLPEVWRSIKDLMGENKLVIVHGMESGENDYIVTKILHAETGESIESRSRIMLQKSTAQEYGSYITYMRRYALTAMLGLVTDEDDDGHKANEKATKETKEKVEKKPDPMVELCAKVKSQLIASTTIEAVNFVWDGFQETLAPVKKQNPKWYESLESEYKKHLTWLAQETQKGK
jgi:hypothetical protein